MSSERSSRGTKPSRRLSSQAITFVIGLILSLLAVGALVELRARMMDAFATLGAINVLQESRTKSVEYLIGAENRRIGGEQVSGQSTTASQDSHALEDLHAFEDELAALRSGARSQPLVGPAIDAYVLDATASLTSLGQTPADADTMRQDFAKARNSSDSLDLALEALVGKRRGSLQQDISRIVFAVGALIVAVAIISLTQGWEMLVIGRRLFTTQTDNAATIASLSTTLSENREALARMNLRLTLAMRSAHVVVFSIEPSALVTWSLDAGNGVFGSVSTPFLLSDLSPSSDRPRIVDQVADASRSRETVEFEMQVEGEDKDLRWMKVTLLPLNADAESSLLGSAVDITDIKRREEGNILLMRELSHRSKNLLAVVQAMARQTAKTTPSPVEFYERFGTRLRALAAGHDLLVKSVYVSAELGELIHSQIGALASLIGTRIVLDGPPVRLRPEATQNLGMALHELAANAQIHGAMSSPNGRLNVTWRLEGTGADGRLIMDWIESGGPKPHPSVRRGFGSTLILENLPRSLHGTVTLDHSSDGAHCHMEFPLDYLLEGWKPKGSGVDQSNLAS